MKMSESMMEEHGKMEGGSGGPGGGPGRGGMMRGRGGRGGGMSRQDGQPNNRSQDVRIFYLIFILTNLIRTMFYEWLK